MDVLLEALNLPFGQPNALLGQIYNASPQQKALPLGQHLLITYLYTIHIQIYSWDAQNQY